MTRSATLLLLSVALGASAAAQTVPAWQELAASPYNSYRSEDVFFIGERGWAVTGVGGGKAYRTLDGGASWSPPVLLDGYLRATGFATPVHGWIGVLWNASQLYETTDGGVTYADVTGRIQPAVPGGICGIWVQDEQTVWAAGQYISPAYILKTADGGATWTSRAMAPLADELVDIRFFDSQHGLASGGTGPSRNSRARIIGTDDGGQTWTVRHTTQTPYSIAWKLTFPTRLVGYASVERLDDPEDGSFDSVVLKTVDGGQTWTELRIPGGGSLQGIGFLTAEVGWASGRGRTSMTTDGGLTWARLPPTSQGGQLDGDVNRFRFVGDSLAYAAGHKIYRLRGRFPTTAATDDASLADGLAGAYPNPARGPVTVGYRTAAAGPVRLDVLDVQGRTVATLVDAPVAPGEHVATWAAGVAPGVYVVRMRAAGGVSTLRVAVVAR